MKTRREHIMDVIGDIIIDLFYYDRREDDTIGVGGIEQAVSLGEITVDEIVEAFRNGVYNNVVNWDGTYEPPDQDVDDDEEDDEDEDEDA